MSNDENMNRSKSLAPLLAIVLLLAVTAFFLVGRDWGAPPRSEGRPPVAGAGNRESSNEPFVGEPKESSAATADAPSGSVRLYGTVRLLESNRAVGSGVLWISHVPPYRENYQAVRGGAPARGDEEQELLEIDAAGGYSVDLPRGTVVVEMRLDEPGAFDEAMAEYIGAVIEMKPFLMSGDRHLDLEANPGLQIHGVVADAATGVPIHDAVVRLSEKFGSPPGCRADDAGRFQLSGLEESHWLAGRRVELVAEKPPYLPRRVMVGFAEDSTSVAGVRIELLRGVVLAGHLVQKGRPPRDKARITLSVDPATPAAWGTVHPMIAVTKSEDDGSFRFPPIRPAQRATIEVSYGGTLGGGTGGGGILRNVDARRDHDDLRVQIGPSIRINVHARYPSGSPVGGAAMRVIFWDHWGNPQLARIQRKDRWLFDAPPDREYRVRVFARPAGDWNTKPMPFYVGTTKATPRPGETGREIIVQLREVDPPADPSVPKGVHGIALNAKPYCRFTWLLRVVDGETGKPLSSARYALRDIGTGGGGGLLGDGGRFLFSGSLGRHAVRLRCWGYEDQFIWLGEAGNGFKKATVRLHPIR